MANNGKEVCGRLKEIRRQVAEANGIPYEPAECHSEGECRGTCPKCEEELKYLSEAIEMKKENGEEVTVSVVSETDDLESVHSIPFDDGSEVYTTMGLMLPEEGFFPYEPLPGDISLDESLPDDLTDDADDVTVGTENE